MIEIGTPEIDSKEIMARIREEVEKYNNINAFANINQRALFSECPIIADYEPLACEPHNSHGQTYKLGDFLPYQGSDFIDNAYFSILRRQADHEGRKLYLSKLQNGTLTKIDILGRLRYSREGRNKRVFIKGLLPRFIVHTLFKIPVLGWVGRILSGILKLPTILKNIQVIECAVFAHRQLAQEQAEKNRGCLVELRDHVALLQEEISLTLIAERQAMDTRIDNLSKVLSDIKSDKVQLNQIIEQIRDYKLNILDMERRVQLLLEEARKRFPEPMSHGELEVFANEEDHLLDAMYVSFEERFRGTREDIKERIRVYLPHVKKAAEATGNLPVLDVGCGRGEWLELLKDNDIKAQGVDLNRVMVSQCLSRGFSVLEADVINHLRSLKAGSLSVVSGFHIVEHLPFKTLITLFDEARRVLKPGGIVIFETPNPENLIVGGCTFYTDPSHEKPIPPVTLSFLAEARGFVNVEILRLNKNPWIVIDDPFLKSQFDVEQDYSVIGHRV